MSTPAHKVPGTNPGQGGERPQSSGESTPAEPLREAFRRRLFQERKGKESGSEPERPTTKETPEGPVSEVSDEEYETSEEEETTSEESSTDTEDEEFEDVEDEEGPDDEESTATLTVDGRQYTAEDIKALEAEREKREAELKEYDADYRRKTQVLSRHRQEYEAMSQETQGVSTFMMNVAKSNLEALEKVDLSQLSPEETAQWKKQYDATKQGYQELMRYTDNVRQQIRKNREAMLDKQAEASSGVLSSLDPRWNDQSFYPALRQFAVESGRYTAEEFADVTDWRTLEGLIALMDKAEAEKLVQGKIDQQEPVSRKRKRRTKVRKNPKSGRFESAQQQVMQSRNAKGDGSLRNYFQERLAKERASRGR